MEKDKKERNRRGFFGRVLVFLLSVLAVIGVIAMAASVLSSFVNPERFAWPALFGLGFWAIFIYNVLIFTALLLLWSKKAWIAVLALLIAVPGLMKSVTYKKHQGEGQLRVLSYNVMRFKDYRDPSKTTMDVAYEIANMVRDKKPDVVCMQEFAQFMSKTKRSDCIAQYGEMMGLPYFYYHTKSHFGGNVIFSKYPLTAVEDESPFGEENLYGAVAHVDAGDKGAFDVICCHLTSFLLTREELSMFSDTSNTKLERQEYSKSVVSKLINAYQRRSLEVQRMLAYVPQDGRPIILCGDMNDTPLSYTYYQLSRNGFKDAFLMAGKGIGRTYAGKLPLLRIDYAWVNQGIVPTSFKRIRYRGSDHYPVMMDFNLEKGL